MNCYYEGMTIENAVEMYQKSYVKTIPLRSIQSAKKTIKETTGKEW